MTFNLISKQNGVGLSQDVAILTEVLQRAGHSVTFTDWQQVPSRRYDVNVFFELLNPMHINYARKNVGIFNPEWFQESWVQYLPSLTQVWARTEVNRKIFSKYNGNTVFIGWTSRDLYDPNIKKKTKFLHLRGKNSYKGTQSIIDCWVKNPDLPELFLVASEVKNFEKRDAPNITYLIGYQTNETILDLMNKCQFHLCPSECEGYGYYIVEAMSCKGFVLTTDAPPMNEHINRNCGTLIHYDWLGKTHLSDKYRVESEAIHSAVKYAMQIPEKKILQRQENARKLYLQRKSDFEKRILEVINTL